MIARLGTVLGEAADALARPSVAIVEHRQALHLEERTWHQSATTAAIWPPMEKTRLRRARSSA